MEVTTRVRRAALITGIAVGGVLLLRYLSLRQKQKKQRRYRASIKRLLRYPVKGLDFTEQALPNVTLEPNGSFPNDRRWALTKGKPDADYGEFDPQKPQWVHKMRFAASCSEGPALGCFRAEWRDEDCALSLFAKDLTGVNTVETNAAASAMLPPTSLLGADTLRSVETFFQESLGDYGLKVVSAFSGKRHQFANTKPLSGMEGLLTLHIVNLATVEALSKAANVPIDWRRFRPNILLDSSDELPPWAEFEWVGRRVRAGSAWLRITKRTIRCDSTKVNPANAMKDLDVPKLLQQHFPEHGPYLGVYAVVEGGGDLRPGDALEGPF